jgi:hypothetical protein
MTLTLISVYLSELEGDPLGYPHGKKLSAIQISVFSF